MLKITSMNFLKITILLLSISGYSQIMEISGRVTSNGEPVSYADVYIEGSANGTSTDRDGYYSLSISPGKHTITAYAITYKKLSKNLDPSVETTLNFNLKEDLQALGEVVVTGTRTVKRSTESAIIVNLINSETLENVQACNLSEGLRFQPGLRVETDCQTCNYTQLRMNGLGGGYSQILINGRPIFSPLTGLYGLEQIPVNMIERIEIVRGGGSALYGSSAIGGTVNVITKIPKSNDYNFSYTYQNIQGTADHIMSGNATVVSKNRNSGATFFVGKRERETYDHNNDNFSELPELNNTSFGANFYYLPSEDSKLEMSISSINEYRYGGEMVEKAAHLTQQSEERTHNVLMGSVDYQINFNDYKNALIFYFGGQKTDRDHYTGIIPESAEAIEVFNANPPYGTSKVTTYQGGTQFNHKLSDFFNGETVLTLGAEYIYDDVYDIIDAYNYKIDQTTRTFGAFLQNDWDITPSLNFLAGARLDNHNLVDSPIISPRMSLLYKIGENTQLRASWGTGFRAPQAFDTDLHIAFAGGGISRIVLSENLKEERSNSYSASINYDKPTENFIAGFTLEGFYTTLDDAFYLNPIGEDEFGEMFEKRNGQGATVKGITLETRLNLKKELQIEAGFTLQSSLYNEPVENIEGLALKREFLRTPDDYGYATLTYSPNKKFNSSINLVYTGQMDLMHLAGAPEQSLDEYFTSPSFTELSIKTGYTFNLKKLNTGLELFGGIKNLTNAYQQNFDSGKNRDSNFVYGPAAPRTIFMGIKLQSNN